MIAIHEAIWFWCKSCFNANLQIRSHLNSLAYIVPHCAKNGVRTTTNLRGNGLATAKNAFSALLTYTSERRMNIVATRDSSAAIHAPGQAPLSGTTPRRPWAEA